MQFCRSMVLIVFNENFLLDFPSFRKISNFLQMISSDSVLRSIFQLSLCHGRLTAPETQKPSPVEPVSSKKIYFSSSESEEETEKRPTEEEMIEFIREENFSRENLTIRNLLQLEKRFVENFKVKSFEQICRGSFLEFLDRNEEKIFDKNSLSENENFLIDREEIQQFLVKAKRVHNDFQFVRSAFAQHFQTDFFEKSLFDSVRAEQFVENNIFYCSLIGPSSSEFDSKPTEGKKFHRSNSCFSASEKFATLRHRSSIRNSQTERFVLSNCPELVEIDRDF